MEPNETSLMMQQQLNVMSKEYIPNFIGTADDDESSYDHSNPVRHNLNFQFKPVASQQ